MIYTFTQTAVNEQSYSRQYAIVLLLLCLVFLMKGFIPSKLINSFLKIIYTSALFPVKLQFLITNFRVALEKRKKTTLHQICYFICNDFRCGIANNDEFHGLKFGL